MTLGDNMLVKFSVKNYKNFKDRITIDFSEIHDYKFSNNCIKNGLLNKLMIFGHNGVGKSNLGYALFDIISTLTDKHIDVDQGNNYINADSEEKYAQFNYKFRFDNKDIEYNYKKSELKKMIYEELYIDNQKIYDYDFLNNKINNYNKLDLIEASTLNFEYYESNMAVLRYIVNNTVQSEHSLIKQLMQFVTKMLWFRSLKDNRFIGYENEGVTISDWIVKNNLVKEFNEFLIDKADLNLKLSFSKLLDKNILIEQHKNAPLVWESVASSGSSALILYFYWYKHFNEISFLFIDEFDAFYHFELSRKIVESIVSYDNMQTILTSHNTNLADNDLLRPDCYFTLKDGKLTSFADSTDRELREGHNLEKMLKQGEFDG